MQRLSLRFWVVSLSLAWGSGGAWVGGARGGDLDPPGGAVAPTMKTLEEVEPRVAVTAENTPGDAAAGFVIDARGSYYLTGNLSPTSGDAAIRIEASDVTLDLSGFTLDGTGMGGGQGIGIRVTGTAENVRIRDGVLNGWPLAGVFCDAGSDTHLRRLRFRDCVSAGAVIIAGSVLDCRVDGGQIGLGAGPDAIVEGCVVAGTSSSAIAMLSDGVVRGCVVRDVAGKGIDVGSGMQVVEGNVVEGATGPGVFMGGVLDGIIRDNHVAGCGVGVEVGASSPITVRGNTVERNTDNYVFPVGGGSGVRLELILSEIPETIEWACRVELAGTLTGVAGENGITIASDDVTIDLGGHALVGVANSEDGIGKVLGGTFDNITVRHGVVRGWGEDGIDLFATIDSTGGRVEDCRVADCGFRGISCAQDAVVRRCSVSGCSTGIVVSRDGLVESCTAIGNITGIDAGVHSAVISCVTNKNTGTGVRSSSGCHIVDCTASENGTNGFSGGSNETIRGCSAYLNGAHGISVDTNSLVLRNKSVSNGQAGIRLDSGFNNVDGNYVRSNDIGVQGTMFGAENTVVRNTADGNTTAGYSLPGSTRVGAIQTSPVGAGPWDNFEY